MPRNGFKLKILYMKTKYLLWIGLGALFIGLFSFFDPLIDKVFPICPFHYFTGFDCPGCGSQRAVFALLHGDLTKAADHNLLLVVTLPFLTIHTICNAFSIVAKKDLRFQLIHHPAVPYVAFALMLMFWLLRNIPSPPFNYLAA